MITACVNTLLIQRNLTAGLTWPHEHTDLGASAYPADIEYYVQRHKVPYTSTSPPTSVQNNWPSTNPRRSTTCEDRADHDVTSSRNQPSLHGMIPGTTTREKDNDQRLEQTKREPDSRAG